MYIPKLASFLISTHATAQHQADPLLRLSKEKPAMLGHGKIHHGITPSRIVFVTKKVS